MDTFTVVFLKNQGFYTGNDYSPRKILFLARGAKAIPGQEYECTAHDTLPENRRKGAFILTPIKTLNRVSIGDVPARGDSNGKLIGWGGKQYLGRYKKGDRLGAPSGYGATRVFDAILALGQRGIKVWRYSSGTAHSSDEVILCEKGQLKKAREIIKEIDVLGYEEDTNENRIHLAASLPPGSQERRDLLKQIVKAYGKPT